MPVKLTGKQYKAFLSSDWGPDAMWEDTEILRNGEPMDEDSDSNPDAFADTDEVTIVAGTIIPDQTAPASRTEFVDAVKFAKKWLKAQSTVTLLVEVPRDGADEIAKLIAQNGTSAGMARVVGRIG